MSGAQPEIERRTFLGASVLAVATVATWAFGYRLLSITANSARRNHPRTDNPITALDQLLVAPGGKKLGREKLLYLAPGEAEAGIYILDLEPGVLNNRFANFNPLTNPQIELDVTRLPDSLFRVTFNIAEKGNPSSFNQSRAETLVTADPNKPNLLVVRWTNWRITAFYWNQTLQQVQSLNPLNPQQF